MKTQIRTYKQSELALILSVAPTKQNIQNLTDALGRSESAIKLVYRRAYGHGSFPNGKSFGKKVLAAKQQVGIDLGRKTLPAKPKRSYSLGIKKQHLSSVV
ncbi:MAG TPA: hypothetical protein VFV23_10865 [Verrucomicrobiae bacterium]|nr:hypothetical protein [Verrucomicrobiae bacterium]